MTKFYITFSKTTNWFDWDDMKRHWDTTDNCLAAIEADTEEEAKLKLIDLYLKDGATMANCKISTTNPVF